jgi:hypothetical protein
MRDIAIFQKNPFSNASSTKGVVIGALRTPTYTVRQGTTPLVDTSAFLATDLHGTSACPCSISRCRTVLMFVAGKIKKP